jgi:hypothetical protein
MVTSEIRPFRESDIGQVVRLHQSVFRRGMDAPSDAYEAYFRDTFLTGPWPDSGLGSLVCEEAGGELIGFLGAVPLRLTYGGRLLWATVCTQFCVDPKRRGPTGLRLISQHFAGPQDLSITDEANEGTLRLWRWAGGEPALSSSLHFLRPLRPGQFIRSLIAQRPALALVAHLSSPQAWLFDFALARIPQSHFRQTQPSTQGEPLDAAVMAELLPQVKRSRELTPVYEPSALAWYLRRAEAIKECGELRRVLVRDEKGRFLGWYLYYQEPGRVGEVLQVAAVPDATPKVLDHLIYDAWQAGVVALSGRVDPLVAQDYSDRYCLFSRRGPWTLVHSRDPALRLPFHRGDVMFSRLEGERCLRFSLPPS